MNRTLRTLGWLAAVIQEDPEPWFTTDPDTDYVPYVNSFSFESLSLVPDALMLLKRALHLAMEQQNRRVIDLQEALRHVLVFKFHFREEEELELAWNSERTRSAVRLIESVKGRLIAEYKFGFLPRLIFNEEEGIFDLVIEGYTLKVGQCTLSIPWEMITDGYVPASLRNFGELMDTDTWDLEEDPRLRPRELKFEIHNHPNFNPWVSRETLEFMMSMATETGWFHALDPESNSIYAYDLISRMPDFHIEGSFRPHPIKTSWDKLQKIAKAVDSFEEHKYLMSVLKNLYKATELSLNPAEEPNQPSESST